MQKSSLRILAAKGTGITVSPISHGRIRPYHAKKEDGAPLELNQVPVIVEVNNVPQVMYVPGITGNSIRGKMRRMLFRETVWALGLDENLATLFDRETDARMVAFVLRNGGISPRKVSAQTVRIGVYEELRKKIGLLGLFGTFYCGHHIEGDLFCDFMLPIIKETASYLGYDGVVNDLPGLGDLAPYPVVRYARHADVEPFDLLIKLQQESEEGAVVSNDANEEENGDDENDSVKETGADSGQESEKKDSKGMLYGTEVLPIGVKMSHEMSVVTLHESIETAFKAAVYLFVRFGRVGGMLGKGHGKVRMDYTYSDGSHPCEKDLERYLDELISHKNEVLDAIRSIPGELPSGGKSDKKEGNNNSKKGAKVNDEKTAGGK